MQYYSTGLWPLRLPSFSDVENLELSLKSYWGENCGLPWFNLADVYVKVNYQPPEIELLAKSLSFIKGFLIVHYIIHYLKSANW